MPTKVRQIIQNNVTLATIFGKRMKKSGIIAGLFLVAAGGVRAQESASVYHFLQFPQAAHTTALGGVNISAVDDDAAAALNNPALLSTVSDKTLSLNFMTYAASSKQVGATFVKAFGERHTAALEAHYFGYGTMDETDNAGNVVGSFSAKDIAVAARRGCAAICSSSAAHIYGMKVLEDHIEDNKHNFTRFLVSCNPGKADFLRPLEKANKASLVFALPHEEGSLSQVLSILSFYKINLTKIQSLPIIGHEWEYLFYVDVTYDNLTRYRQSIDAITPLTRELKILGEYQDGKQSA